MNNNEKEYPLDKKENPILKSKQSLFFDVERFNHAQRIAKIFSESDMVPKQFHKNLANCLIALNLSERLMVDPFMLMQNMYVVYGRPGIEGKLRIALINGCGRFSPLKFKFEGEGKTNKGVKRPDLCIAYAIEKGSKEKLIVSVSWETVVAEGWHLDKGTQVSKWQTMPYQMFRYRAAAFFERAYCPEVTLGLRDIEEVHDIVELEQSENGSYALVKDKTEEKMEDLKNRLKEAKEEKKEPPNGAKVNNPSPYEQLSIALYEFFDKDFDKRDEFLEKAIGKKKQLSTLSDDECLTVMNKLKEKQIEQERRNQ